MLSIDKERLTDDICFAAREFTYDSSKDMIKYDFLSFEKMNDILFTLSGNYYPISKLHNIKSDITSSIDKNLKSNCLEFFKQSLEGSEDILFLSQTFLELLDSIDYTDISYLYKYKRFREKDFIDIILSYYSTFGNKVYNAVKKYFDEGRIHIGYKELTEGKTKKEIYIDKMTHRNYFIRMIGIESGYIISKERQYDTYTMVNLVHELGHALDAEMFLFPQQKKILTFCDTFVEVPSISFELGFCDFLMKSNMDTFGVLVFINSLLSSIEYRAQTLKTVYTSDNCFIKDNLEVSIPFTEILKKEDAVFDEDGNLFVYDIKLNSKQYTFNENGDIVLNLSKSYDFRKGIIYSLSYYLAAHLNLIRRDSEKDFLKVLNNISLSRKEMNLYELIKLTGFDEDEFMLLELLKPDIEKNTMELKRRYYV